MTLPHQPLPPKTSLRASATQSRKSIQDVLTSVLFVFVFVIFTFSFFNIYTQSVDAQAPSDISETAQKSREAVYQKAHEPKFIPLVGIPYIDNPKEIGSMAEYVSALYKISISIAAFLAVIKIIFAGVKYMLSDVVTDKGAAKKDIRGALIGLLIVIGAVLILNTINPQLRNLNVLSGEGVQVELRNGENRNPYNTQPGTSVVDTDGSINETQWASSCMENGGNFLRQVSGDGFSIFTYLTCSEKTSNTIAKDDLYTQLLAGNTNLTDKERKDYLRALNNNLNTPDFQLSEDDLYYKYTESDELQQYMNGIGLSLDGSNQETIVKVVKENSIFIMYEGLLGDVSPLCSATQGQVIRLYAGYNAFACMK